ncbi:hypothetical protein [Variovorax guangxiensis]|uniref:DUF2628 domain-containing protein n=1 Tax=Variovorax guangxiensis TaxID=1775474 RepID=A0A502DE78_9BURK|nr:hypothetical protein [Variovorax guangxiensis]TPG23463.1 hypothetical protein EAH82_20580 [Variovorax guangxiensis]TPG24078.1 hypothetical protein EAH83_06140 [Variovorax ginsengisoli]
MSVNNIVFAKNNRTRFVKHGWSWQIALFGPIALLMRSQIPLAIAAFVAMVGIYLLAGVITILVLDLDEGPATALGYVAACGAVGYFGNRFSARSYVKNGWMPVDRFPDDWNTPKLIDRPATAS